MNEGITRRVVMRPFAMPTITPTESASRTACQSGQPHASSDTPIR